MREEKFGFKPLVGEEMEIYREARQLVTELYCYRDLKNSGRINMAIGSLGGGNHFIELDKDDEGNVYLVIHTGSRNLGKQVAEIYQAKAVKHLTDGADKFEETIKRTIEEYKAAGRRTELQEVIKKMRKEHEAAEPSLPKELCYLEGVGREQYLHDMRICQRWAVLNRKLIALLLMRFFPEVSVMEEFESVHNYISDDNIIRKGSISAAEGERCIIPLNMRDGSLLCTGKPRLELLGTPRRRTGVEPHTGLRENHDGGLQGIIMPPPSTLHSRKPERRVFIFYLTFQVQLLNGR